MKTATIFCLVFTLLLGSAQADPFGKIKSVKSLPIHGVKLIESDQGVFFVSENGRFAWKGPILDMWNGKKVQTIEDVDAVVNRIDIKKIGIDPDQLATLTLGRGDKQELLFVSTDCPHCKTLLQQAVELGDEYRFRLILLPMGQKSLEHTRQLLCTQDREAAVKALVSGNYEGLGSGDCDLSKSPLQRTMVVSKVLGLRSVPYLIRHDGRAQAGGIKDLAAWLAEADQDKAKEGKKAKETTAIGPRRKK